MKLGACISLIIGGFSGDLRNLLDVFIKFAQ